MFGPRGIHGQFIYPATVWLVGEKALFRSLREMRVNQWLTAEELERRQSKALRALLRQAIQHCPWYQARPEFRAVEAAEDPIAHLNLLPTISKTTIRTQPSLLMAAPLPSRTTTKVTGGSTGEAVTVIKDRRATARERAAMWLGYSWFGVNIGDRVARFWGAPSATSRRVAVRAADFAMHRIRFSAFAFRDEDLEHYWRQTVAFKPAYLHGYVSMLEAFARFVGERGYDGHQLPLKSIVATSEVLNRPQRELLERVFGVPVQVEYGCGEVGPIAYECEKGSLHLMVENLVVEVVREDGVPAERGESGSILITDLTNYAMPLVRYEIGDSGVLGEACPCGRGYPVLERIWGRAYDFIESPDGRRYHGEFFMYLFEDLRRDGYSVGQFKVVQSDPHRIEVLMAGVQSNGESVIGRVRESLARSLSGMSIHVRLVDEIQRTASGKMQVIENRCGRGPILEGPFAGAPHA